jgi:hypothetical protein
MPVEAVALQCQVEPDMPIMGRFKHLAWDRLEEAARRIIDTRASSKPAQPPRPSVVTPAV